MQTNFTTELAGLLNKYSLENHSNTPDYVLAQFLVTCLDAFNQGVSDRQLSSPPTQEGQS